MTPKEYAEHLLGEKLSEDDKSMPLASTDQKTAQSSSSQTRKISGKR